MKNTTKTHSGADALACGAIDAGVALVTGYPGAPVTPVVNYVLEHTSPDQVRVEWASNEKTAIEMAFGGSLGGLRSLLCVKGVGLNVALDPLMAFNLTGCNAGLVLLVGDDPGGWGSQNEQDSRALALAAEIPLLEPTDVAGARQFVGQAFRWSERIGQPVMVRVTRALVLARHETPLPGSGQGPSGPAPRPFQREFMRWVVLPVNVVPLHRRLHQRLDQVRDWFERSSLNEASGDGPQGVIAVGSSSQKLLGLLGDTVPPGVRVLRLGTLHPLPVARLTAFLHTVESVLVIEEMAPLIERAVRAAAQRAGLALPIYGRDTGHIPRVGELFAPHIATALNRLAPHLALPECGETSRPMPSRQSLCDDCPYLPTFDALIDAIARRGGRDAFIITGDPGCMVRAQLPPYKLLDVKNSLGSSIATAAGLSLSQLNPESGGGRKQVIALCGDSSFLHSGLGGLVDAVRVGATMLVLILDNGTTALSGGQPHPATRANARGQPRPAVNLAALARQAGAGMVRTADVDRGEGIRDAIEEGLDRRGVAVVIARGRCPRWTTAA